MWLTAEPQGTLGLVLAHWWAESGSRRLLSCFPLLVGEARSWVIARLLAGRATSWRMQDPGITELVSDHWWEGSLPDTVGYGVWVVPKLVMAC